MTRDEVIGLAKQAGIQEGCFNTPWPAIVFQLEHFANLVAAAEREKCISAVDDIEEAPWYGYENPNTYQDAKLEAMEAIRSRT